MKANYIVLVLIASAALAGSSCLEKNESADPERKCTACHGDRERGGVELANAAPPFDLEGSTDPSSRGVGAHQIHLNASPTHAAVACRECHYLPEDLPANVPPSRSIYWEGHVDSEGPAEFVPGPLASHDALAFEGRTASYDVETRSCEAYCHLDAAPVWNEPRSDSCGTCHTIPPGGAHVQSQTCFQCHPTIDENQEFIDPSRHINGVLDVVGDSCNACHGSDQNPAPPRDTSGNTDTSARGVGAHQSHLNATMARPVLCNECHIVPTVLGDPGHTDSALPAENNFSGVAVALGAAPAFDGTTCANTYCHGAVGLPRPDGFDPPIHTADGALTEPAWTTVDGSQAACGNCHAVPPSAPHPDAATCGWCHVHVDGDAPGNYSFNDPRKHVNGVLDFN